MKSQDISRLLPSTDDVAHDSDSVKYDVQRHSRMGTWKQALPFSQDYSAKRIISYANQSMQAMFKFD